MGKVQYILPPNVGTPKRSAPMQSMEEQKETFRQLQEKWAREKGVGNAVRDTFEEVRSAAEKSTQSSQPTKP
jgi:hypothetical protein